MSIHNVEINTPAATWAWLTRRLSALDKMPGRSISGEWSKFKSEMDGKATLMIPLTNWPSDFWIAKTQYSSFSIAMEPVWAIPERLDQWPTLEMQDPSANTLLGRTRTNSASFLNLLARTNPTRLLSDSDPIHRFFELVKSSTTLGDEAMISANQIRAWLITAFGDLLRGVALTPVDDDQTSELVVQAVTKRLSDVDSLRGPLGFMDYGCDILYNARMTQNGLRTTSVRQGQGEDWQHHWEWISARQDAGAMTATLQLAGLLLINEPLLIGLASTIRNGDDASQKRALCVTRRWLLTAKVLAWLFEALQHHWTSVRPQDLACFAFSALSPTWPRRAVALSHRSKEAKPILSTLKMWNSPHAAIDASYVPAWETNIGMIWSLYASVPQIVRVESPAYFESEWCSREHEMFKYLVEHADFLEGRAIVDIGVDQLAQLDDSLFEDWVPRIDHPFFSVPSSRTKPFLAPKGEFPPFSLVLVGNVPVGIDLAILRAAAALRLINALVRNPALANEIASRTAAGDDLEVEVPTNNPDGWAAYGDVFRDLEALALHEPATRPIVEKLHRRSFRHSLSLLVPDDYSALDVQRDIANGEQIPDLRGGQYRFGDVLAALEWRRTVFEWFRDEDFGDKVMVDVSGSNADEWTTLPHMSVARGLLNLNGFPPTWIMQRAGQNAHLWPGFREQPIFTRHVDEQFNWLKPVFLDPCWLIYYLANSGLRVESNLETAMIAAVVHSAGPEAVKVVHQAEGAGLIVPEPRSFFTIPNDAAQDWYNQVFPPTDPRDQ